MVSSILPIFANNLMIFFCKALTNVGAFVLEEPMKIECTVEELKQLIQKEPPSTEALSSATILSEKSLDIIRRVLLNTDFLENMK